jgi:hypothetical protein
MPLCQQAEDRFEQVIGLSHEFQQSLPLLQGPGKGLATNMNGLIYWVLEDILILHAVAKVAGLESHGAADVIDTPYVGQVESSCAYWVPLEDRRGAMLTATLASLPGSEGVQSL